MPNHIVNQLIINTNNQRTQEVLSFLKGTPFEDGSLRYIDFNKIISKPKELDIEVSSRGDLGMNILRLRKSMCPSYNDLITLIRFQALPQDEQDRTLELGQKYLSNIAVYGAKNWCDWSIKFWGTQWNAYDQQFEAPNVLWFSTAWHSVTILIQRLSEKFPDVEFKYTYADEDTGNNTGTGTFKGGIPDMFFPDNGSQAAFELAFKMRPYLRDYFELTETGYQWKEEEE